MGAATPTNFIPRGDATLYRTGGIARAYNGSTAAARGTAIAQMFTDSLAGDTLLITADATIPSTLTLKAKQKVIVNGSLLAGASNMTMFTASSVDDWSISGGGLLTGLGTGSTETAISILTCNRYLIEGIQFYLWNGYGVDVAGTISGMSLYGRVSHTHCRTCVTGMRFGQYAEYSTVTGSMFDTCTLGIDVTGANNVFQGCKIRSCTTGANIRYLSGNHAHGTFLACDFNHSVDYALVVGNITQGFDLIGCHFYANNGSSGYLNFGACSGVSLVGGELDSPISFSGTPVGPNFVRGMFIAGSYASITATPGQRRYFQIFDCYNSTVPSTLNDSYPVGFGATGKTSRTVGEIPFARNSDGSLRGDGTNFLRNASTGATEIKGPTTLTGASLGGEVGQVVIESGANGNVAAIIQGKNDSVSPPVSVAGLTPTLWWKADSLTSISHGQAITSITDSSGNSRTGTKAGAGTIYYVADFLNGLPVMYFDGALSAYIDSPSFTLAQPYTLFAVARALSTGNNKVITCGKGGDAALLYSPQATTYEWNCGTARTFAATPTNWNILECKGEGATTPFARANGGTANTSSPGTNSITSGFRVGDFRAPSSTTYSFYGYIAEIILFPSALSATNAEGVRQYLSSKYNITITQGTAGAANQTSALLQARRNSAASVRFALDYEGNPTLPAMDSTARDAITTPTGKLILNTTTNKIQGHDGTNWVDLH